MQIFLFLALTSLSCALSVVAIFSCNRVTRLLRTRSVRSALEVSSEMAAMQSSLESLSTTVRRLSSRYGMAEKRGRDGKAHSSQAELPVGDPNWKAHARALYLKAGKPLNHKDS